MTTHAMWTEGGVELVPFLTFCVQPIPVVVEGPLAVFHPRIPMAYEEPPAILCSKISTQIWHKLQKLGENYGGYENRGNYEKLRCNMYLSQTTAGSHARGSHCTVRAKCTQSGQYGMPQIYCWIQNRKVINLKSQL